jgi:glycerol-3-phosphate cytidylyltransferase
MAARVLESKIIPFENIAQLALQLKSQGKKIITTNGCFDLLHLGHISYLHEARQMGDVLIVGINSDLSVQKLKGKSRPLNPERIRALQLSGLESVSFVTIFNENTPETLLKLIQPHIHVKGGDYKIEDLPERHVVESGGGKVICVSLIAGYSTTGLIEKLKASE